jgi:hypothetical protein
LLRLLRQTLLRRHPVYTIAFIRTYPVGCPQFPVEEQVAGPRVCRAVNRFRFASYLALLLTFFMSALQAPIVIQ